MKNVIESVENWQKVMMFIGQHIDYQFPYLPNLPFWGLMLDNQVADYKLIVATSRNEQDEIVACCVAQVYTGDVAAAQAINPEFQAVVRLGGFGDVSQGLSDFCDDVARQFVKM